MRMLTSLALLAFTAGADTGAAPRERQEAAPTTVTLQAGTVINVRLTQGIDVDVAQAGMTFTARVDDPVTLDGRIIIPREASALVQAVGVGQSGQFKGADRISLKLSSLSIGGRVYQVATEYAVVQGGGEGRRTARKVGGGAGLGAIFGGVAGGGEGALIGATVGAVAGAAVSASGEEHLRLAAETRLRFPLSSSLRIHV